VLPDDITLRVGAERLSKHPAGNQQNIGHMFRAVEYRLLRDLSDLAGVYLTSLVPGSPFY